MERRLMENKHQFLTKEKKNSIKYNQFTPVILLTQKADIRRVWFKASLGKQ
jgi:hypothetical protein